MGLVGVSGVVALLLAAPMPANRPPDGPTQYETSPATACGAYDLIGNTSVTLSARVSDPDGPSVLQVEFTVDDETDGTSSGPVITPAVTDTVAILNLPSSRLADGHTYGWRVRAFDGELYGASTPTCHFIVNQRQPAAPVASSVTYPRGYNGPPARTPGDFTFAVPPGTDPPVRYYYTLNSPLSVPAPDHSGPVPGGAVVDAAPGGGPTTVEITPRRPGSNRLYVQAINVAGNPSEPAMYPFGTSPLLEPDVAGDFDGDRRPDFVVAGTAARPGLWVYRGTGGGHLSPAGVEVGGDGVFSGGPGTWTGAQVSSFDVNGDGLNDLFVHTSAAGGYYTAILPGNGDGTFDSAGISLVDVTDAGGHPVRPGQLVAGTTLDLGGMPIRDLYGTIGDNLYLFPPTFPPGTFDAPQLVSAGWSGWTISPAQSGQDPALYARNDATGELDLWIGNAATGVPPGAAGSVKTVVARRGFSAAKVPVIEGGDIDVDGRPDFWAVQKNGDVVAYLSNGGKVVNHLDRTRGR
jgi:hypothetical protein